MPPGNLRPLVSSEPAAPYEPSSTWLADRRSDAIIIGGSVVAFVATYLVYYPRMYSTEDDATYLASAYALRHGHVTLDSLHQSVVQSFLVGHHLVSQYPPGMPAVLAVASLPGWTWALGLNLAVVLATFALVALLLRRHRIPTYFALLYLLYPTAVLFSRTVMADLLSGLLIAAALAAVLDRRAFLVGLLLGSAVLVRSANILACLTVPAGVVFDLWRKDGPAWHGSLRWLGRFAIGAAPAALTAALAYYAVDGGHSLGHTGQFALGYLPHYLPRILVGMLLMYPLMLVSPLFMRSPAKTPIVFTCYGFILLYGSWFFQDRGRTRLETLVVSQRYLLAVLPLFVVAYADVVWRLGQRLRFDRLAAVRRAIAAMLVAVVLVVGSVAIQRAHQRHVSTLANVRTALLSAVGPDDLLICDKELAKLFIPAWGSRHIYIVADQPSGEVRSYAEIWAAEPDHAGRRVLVANWSAGGLGGDLGGDRNAASLVAGLLPTVPIVGAQRDGLPADLQFLQVSTGAGL